MANTNKTTLPATPTSTAVAALNDDALKFLQEQGPTNDFKAGDKVVPWLVLVQSSGGFMKRGHASYNPEAREGDITDNLSGRLRSHQTVILCKFEVHYTTWKAGGGKLIKQWFTDPAGWNAARFPEGKSYGNKIDADGNEVVQSNVYYILAVDPETGMFTPMVWSLSSTQFGKAKKINSLATEMMLGPNGPFIPPIFSRMFDLTSAIETGGPDGNKSWAGWVFNVGDAVLSHKYGMMWTQAAIQFRKEIEAGNVRPALPEERDGATSEDDGGEPRDARPRERSQATTAANSTDEIPF